MPGSEKTSSVVSLALLKEIKYHTDVQLVYWALPEGAEGRPPRPHGYASDAILRGRYTTIRDALFKAAMKVDPHDYWDILVYVFCRLECAIRGGFASPLRPFSVVMGSCTGVTLHELATYGVGIHPASILDVEKYRSSAYHILVDSIFEPLMHGKYEVGMDSIPIIGGMIKQRLLQEWIETNTRLLKWTTVPYNDRMRVERLIAICMFHCGPNDMSATYEGVKFAYIGAHVQCWHRYACPSDLNLFRHGDQFIHDKLNLLHKKTTIDPYDLIRDGDHTALMWAVVMLHMIAEILTLTHQRDVWKCYYTTYDITICTSNSVYINPITHTLWYSVDGTTYVEVPPARYEDLLLHIISTMRDDDLTKPLYLALWAPGQVAGGTYISSLLGRIK